MAVRFDADGESYTRATGLGAVTVFTVALWAKLMVDRAATSVLWQIDDGSGASFLRVTAWNGSALAFQTSGSTWFGTIGHTLVVDQWTFVGVSGTSNPGQARTAVRAAGSTTFAGGSPAQTNVTVNATTLRLGDGQAASEWLNGSIAAVKVWDQALTRDELMQESWTYQPKRTAGLRGWYPLLTNTLTDFSGLAQTLTGGSGAALDDPPPIAWSAGRRRIVIPASVTPITLTETGTADDQIAAIATASLDDTAAATDALTATASTTLTEDVTVTDALTATVTTTLTETVTGTDDLTGGSPVSLSDSAAITDDLTAVAAPVLDEPVAGTDTLAITAATGLSETATATDSLTASEVLFKTLADTVTGTDALTVAVREDVTLTAAGLRRGWTSRGLQPAWDGLNVASAWTARDIARGWTEDGSDRSWNASTPTV